MPSSPGPRPRSPRAPVSSLLPPDVCLQDTYPDKVSMKTYTECRGKGSGNISPTGTGAGVEEGGRRPGGARGGGRRRTGAGPGEGAGPAGVIGARGVVGEIQVDH